MKAVADSVGMDPLVGFSMKLILSILAINYTAIAVALYVGCNMGFDMGVANEKASEIISKSGACLYHNGKKECTK